MNAPGFCRQIIPIIPQLTRHSALLLTCEVASSASSCEADSFCEAAYSCDAALYCEVASSYKQALSFFPAFAQLSPQVVPHSWVFGSTGMPAVPETISMSVMLQK